MSISLDNFASIATAGGVIFAAIQIWQSKKIAQTTFEDSLDQQYRSLIMVIPVDALLGKPVSGDDEKRTREAVYNYLDLCNEQIYLRQTGRISKKRWIAWSEGIKFNLSKPKFKEIWEEVKNDSPDTFSSLYKLIDGDFQYDPKNWK